MEFKFSLSRIIELEEVTTTQDTAKQLAETYGEDCVLVQAKTQTNGRGRYDRIWDSAEGGLYISLLLRPKKQIKDTFDLSVKTGQAAAKTLKELYGIKTKIKLPNDVLAEHRGVYKKISGILIETSGGQEKLNWLVVGIGVNLNNTPRKEIKAVSAAEIIKERVDIEAFRNALIKNFSENYLQWQMNEQK
jgi:BirA family biotin operon repressor/biotin-[acetyl-CoA-carboxylase] ligase